MSGPVTTQEITKALPLKASAEFHFVIPSTPAALAAAVGMVHTTMEWMAFEPDWIFRTELSLHEALLNAHLHGNHADETCEIRVGCTFASNRVELDIQDQGSGYNAPSESTLRDKFALHGRGLYLIRQCMHSVGIHSDGARIVMSLSKE